MGVLECHGEMLRLQRGWAAMASCEVGQGSFRARLQTDVSGSWGNDLPKGEPRDWFGTSTRALVGHEKDLNEVVEMEKQGVSVTDALEASITKTDMEEVWVRLIYLIMWTSPFRLQVGGKGMSSIRAEMKQNQASWEQGSDLGSIKIRGGSSFYVWSLSLLSETLPCSPRFQVSVPCDFILQWSRVAMAPILTSYLCDLKVPVLHSYEQFGILTWEYLSSIELRVRWVMYLLLGEVTQGCPFLSFGKAD